MQVRNEAIEPQFGTGEFMAMISNAKVRQIIGKSNNRQQILSS